MGSPFKGGPVRSKKGFTPLPRPVPRVLSGGHGAARQARQLRAQIARLSAPPARRADAACQPHPEMQFQVFAHPPEAGPRPRRAGARGRSPGRGWGNVTYVCYVEEGGAEAPGDWQASGFAPPLVVRGAAAPKPGAPFALRLTRNGSESAWELALPPNFKVRRAARTLFDRARPPKVAQNEQKCRF